MRKTYIDNIRWITVVLVVIYHVIYMFNGITVYGIIGPFSKTQPQDVYQYIVYPWFMLLLFAVSGMSARFSLETCTDRDFIQSRTTKLLVPSTIGLFVWGWAMGYYNMLIGGAFEQGMNNIPGFMLYPIMCISGTGVLWYIQMLWLFSVILVWIRKIEKDRIYNRLSGVNIPILIVFALVIFGAAQILNTPVVVVYRFGIYGAGFLAGYFILSHDEVMERVERCWMLLLGLAITSGVLFVVMYFGKSYADHEVLDTLVCNLYAWFATLGVLAFMTKWGGFENRFSVWMKQKSWGIYIFHYFPLAVTAWYLKQLAPGMNPFVVYVLVGIAAFAGSVVMYEVLSRIPFIRWCVLGIKRKKESE